MLSVISRIPVSSNKDLNNYRHILTLAEIVIPKSVNCTNCYFSLDIHNVRNVLAHVGMQVTMKEVLIIVNDLPNGKFSVFDSLNSESLKHVDPLVCLFLSFCFTCMFTNCYMPSFMIKSIIVPLVKNKCGNLVNKNNYRPIALSSISSKVFEHMSFCFALKTIYGLMIINLDSSPYIPLNFVFMLLKNLLSISKVDPFVFM